MTMASGVNRHRYDPSAHTIASDAVDHDTSTLVKRNQAAARLQPVEFGSPDEALAAIEEGIQQLKSGQLDMQEFATLLRAVLKVIEVRSEPASVQGNLMAALSTRYQEPPR